MVEKGRVQRRFELLKDGYSNGHSMGAVQSTGTGQPGKMGQASNALP